MRISIWEPSKHTRMATPKLPKKKRPYYQDVDGFRIPGSFVKEALRSAKDYNPRPCELFIVTYPRCGSTWVQYIVTCIYRRGKAFGSAKEFFTQTPFLELTGAEAAETMQRPGAIKLHLPFHITPWSNEAKYIFVARNPKDTCVSMYHHTKNSPHYHYEHGSFDDFFELFLEGEVDFGDYFDTLLSWYQHKKDPNVLFITYEQLRKDTRMYILKIAEFMGPQYKEALKNDEKLLQDVIHYSSFDFMKENVNKFLTEICDDPDLPFGLRAFLSAGEAFHSNKDSVHFIRKGVVGDWRNYFSSEQNERIDKKFRERTAETDLAEQWKHAMEFWSANVNE